MGIFELLAVPLLLLLQLLLLFIAVVVAVAVAVDVAVAVAAAVAVTLSFFLSLFLSLALFLLTRPCLLTADPGVLGEVCDDSWGGWLLIDRARRYWCV